jgi:PAS domain S-box-containing protein
MSMNIETKISAEEFKRVCDELDDQTRLAALLQEELEETNRGVVALYAELDKQAEQLRDASQLSESKFRTIYAQAPSGIVLLDRGGIIVGANPAMLALLKLDVDQVVGQTLSSFAPYDWRERIDALFAEAEISSKSQDVPMRRSDGETIYLECSVASKIEPGVSMVVATDVSERRHLEQRRLQWLERERIARVEAEQVSRLKDDFIAILSHELRTPLNAILSWAHVLRMRGGTEEAMRGLAAIERNGKTQARMIADLLDMSRLNLGKLPLTFSSIDPGEEIASAVGAMQPSLDEKVISVDLQLAPAYRRIEADASRLQQVIWNLLSNAIKFSPKGSTIRICPVQDDAGLGVSITDMGTGIEAHFLPFVFDRFAQSDAPSNRHRGGLGLGLAIVKQLVEAHGGTIAVHSEGLGQGSTFTFWLPTAQGRPGTADAEDSGPVDLDSVQTSDLPLAGLDLLVVDDDREASAMLRIILGDRGAAVRCASSAQEALCLLDEQRPDVLISDIGMPEKDGYELIREVRAKEAARPQPTGGRSRIAAIALTSFSRPQDRELALSCGFDAHCAKPLKPLSLLQQILALVGSDSGKDAASS